MAALATRHKETAGNLLTNFEASALSAGTKLCNGAGDLVTKDGGQREGNGSADDAQVGVAQAARSHLDQNFTSLGARRADRFDLEALVIVAQHGGAHHSEDNGSFGAHGFTS